MENHSSKRTRKYHPRLLGNPLYRTLLAALAISGWSGIAGAATDGEYFEIQVVDSQSGRGVPLVELVTVNDVRYVTDNAGRIAYRELGRDGETIFFYVTSHGYHIRPDGFGIHGVRLEIRPGEIARIELERDNIAQRLYRVTGQDLYRDSILLGHSTPLEAPLGMGQVAGQDSVQALEYRGRLYWFWGDTNRLAYPLGLFRMAGATSRIPSEGGLDPSRGINLRYFTRDDGFARDMAEVQDPEGVVWLDGICSLTDAAGKQQLVAHYSRRPGLAAAYEQGLMVYNDQREVFEVVRQLPLEESWRFLHNHPVTWKFDGKPYLLMGLPFLVTRVPATMDDVLNPESYESWSCIDPKTDPATASPRRLADGQLDYRWQHGPPVTQREEARWLQESQIQPTEVRLVPADAGAPDERVTMHSGTVRWNAYRKKWILVATSISQNAESPSTLGEVWYAESEQPQGPFPRAVRIVSHQQQTFYNPCHHAFFDQDSGRTILFEGTYCNTFTRSPPTPRYNYNQVMYQLDLDDPQLHTTQ
jgi:hypothetical protein